MVEPGLIAIGSGIAVGLAGIGTGIAQQGIGAAAVGATAEKPEMFGRGLTLMVIPETIVLFGFVIAFLLMGWATGTIDLGALGGETAAP